jgi:hypothetical protein
MRLTKRVPLTRRVLCSTKTRHLVCLERAPDTQSGAFLLKTDEAVEEAFAAIEKLTEQT